MSDCGLWVLSDSDAMLHVVEDLGECPQHLTSIDLSSHPTAKKLGIQGFE